VMSDGCPRLDIDEAGLPEMFGQAL
jgi:hypothetical protein